MRLVGSRHPPPRVRARTATLRFCHPYAAVAVVRVGGDYDLEQRTMVRRVWGGVPVFSAWVAEGEDAEEGEVRAQRRFRV